jgi:hypothetical protein
MVVCVNSMMEQCRTVSAPKYTVDGCSGTMPRMHRNWQLHPHPSRVNLPFFGLDRSSSPNCHFSTLGILTLSSTVQSLQLPPFTPFLLGCNPRVLRPHRHFGQTVSTLLTISTPAHALTFCCTLLAFDLAAKDARVW